MLVDEVLLAHDNHRAFSPHFILFTIRNSDDGPQRRSIQGMTLLQVILKTYLQFLALDITTDEVRQGTLAAQSSLKDSIPWVILLSAEILQNCRIRSHCL